MVSVKMDGYLAVGPRVGLVVATHAFWIDGNQPGNACGRLPGNPFDPPRIPIENSRVFFFSRVFGDSRDQVKHHFSQNPIWDLWHYCKRLLFTYQTVHSRLAERRDQNETMHATAAAAVVTT